ncbi:MAG: rhodanese-related (seleno)protein [Syntrophobacteraceae bacterium]
MKRTILKLVLAAFFLCTLSFSSAQLFAAGYSMITADDLRTMQNAQGLVIVDVRPTTSWMFSMSKIKGAIREDPKEVSSWQNKYAKDRPIVLYCQTDVTSLGVGRRLASAGFQNVYVLKGGWSDWSHAKFPTEGK